MPTDIERARPIIKRSQRTEANLAFLGDKRFLFSESEDAFIMYARNRKTWVAMGPPVGPGSKHADLIRRFYELASGQGNRPAFYQVTKAELPVMNKIGLSTYKLGEQGQLALENFSLTGSARRELRYTCRKSERMGCVFEIVPQERLEEVFPGLQQVSNEWLSKKHTREIGFSTGFFDMEYLKNFPVAIVRKEDKIVAFANVLRGGDREELSVDLVRYSNHAPRSAMEYLLVQLMLWGKEHDYTSFNLGMAPLSGLEDYPSTSLWGQVSNFVFRHGEYFYNYQGLRAYKEKFNPTWESRFLACPGGLALPGVLLDVSTLITGGLRHVLIGSSSRRQGRSSHVTDKR